jgi:hypothetical protein
MKVFTRTVLFISLICVLALTFSDGRKIVGADHGDAPALGAVARNDAKLTDLFAFRDRNQLVVILCADPNIPVGTNSYTFQDDVTFEINIDHTTDVSYSDPAANALYGGTIVDPAAIHPDIKFTVTFQSGQPQVAVDGLLQNANAVSVFAGKRDDPFIRGPRIGRNVGAIVLKMPLPFVNKDQSEVLVWASSRVPQLNVPQADFAGRALRSMFVETLNALPPNQHMSVLGLTPDVLIYNTQYDAVYPNGRNLNDDVVDLVGHPGLLATDAPFPSANDVPYLKHFPYLAPPQ